MQAKRGASEFYRDKSGRRYAVGRWRPYVRGEEALAAKLLVAALSLAVRRQRQPPPLARLLELKTHDRIPVDMSASIDHVGKYFTRTPRPMRTAQVVAMALKSWLQYLSLLLLLTATAQAQGDCCRSRAATVTNRKCFGYSGNGRGTRNGAVTEIVHA